MANLDDPHENKIFIIKNVKPIKILKINTENRHTKESLTLGQLVDRRAREKQQQQQQQEC